MKPRALHPNTVTGPKGRFSRIRIRVLFDAVPLNVSYGHSTQERAG